MTRFDDFKLGLVVFLTGACGMVLELVGSRVLSPYFGNSIFVWTSLIGVILGALSLGYFWGGRLADKNKNMDLLYLLLMGASLMVALMARFKDVILTIISTSTTVSAHVELAMVISVVVLFAPASVILGMVMPYVTKMRIEKKKSPGAIIGNLYAISTLGCIVGTFLTGFYLIPIMGNTMMLYLVSGILFLIGALSKPKLLSLVLAGLIFFIFVDGKTVIPKTGVIADIDTMYGRVLVTDVSLKTGESLRYLANDNSGWQSTILLNDPTNIVINYIRAFRLSNEMGRNINRALMLGGAGFTYPRDFLQQNPNAKIDVVEIDPKMVEIAKKYFFLKDDPRMRIFRQDARVYVKRAKEKYDVVFLDAFTNFSIPSHLTTVEFMNEVEKVLSDDGVLMINMISAVEGVESARFAREANTLKKVFPKVEVYGAGGGEKSQTQNLILVAYKKVLEKPIETDDPFLSRLMMRSMEIKETIGDGSVFTDDYAPVEYLTRYFKGGRWHYM